MHRVQGTVATLDLLTQRKGSAADRVSLLQANGVGLAFLFFFPPPFFYLFIYPYTRTDRSKVHLIEAVELSRICRLQYHRTDIV